MTTVVADLVYQRGLSTRFATCPPRFALLLDLRKTRRQPTLQAFVKTGKTFNTNTQVATGMAGLPQRSQGGGRRPEDMSGGRRAVSVADSCAHKATGCEKIIGNHRLFAELICKASLSSISGLINFETSPSEANRRCRVSRTRHIYVRLSSLLQGSQAFYAEWR